METILSTVSDSYFESKKESKICKNIFVENDDYIKVAITEIDVIENSKLVLLMIILIFWILFTVVGYLRKFTIKRKKANLTILKWVPLGLSASIFIGLTIRLTVNKFEPTNFCLMNSQDGLCSDVETNCFTKANHSESLFTSDFGFGKLLVINSSVEEVQSDLGKGYNIVDNLIKPH